MRRGCIVIVNTECDGCHRAMKYGERYLLLNGEGDEKQRLCVDCCLSHGHISHVTVKGNQISTFLSKQ